jgi:hypothetical protein
MPANVPDQSRAVRRIEPGRRIDEESRMETLQMVWTNECVAMAAVPLPPETIDGLEMAVAFIFPALRRAMAAPQQTSAGANEYASWMPSSGDIEYASWVARS